MSADTSTDWEDPEQPAASVRQIGSVRHDLPAAVTSMVGRGREVGEITRLLGEPGVRLVTLTGPGGIGKTRLATAVARELPGNAAFVSLAAIGATELIATAIAQALRIELVAGQPAHLALRDALAARQFLLVLDNFEHLRDGAGLVSGLLAGCPGVTVLATSRIRLGIAGEHVFPVDPLAVPPSTGTIGAAIESIDAVRLFVDRARAAHPPFVLTDQNAQAVATICRRLDGLPLAIELAAARSNLLSPQALAARLENRLQVLANGPSDAPERLQTMRSAIAWSVDLLDEPELLLWRRLGVFLGGCTADAAAAVSGLDDEVFLGTMSSLVDHNLVRITSNVLHEPRFDMLESSRAFALERLAEAGEEATARDAHAAWFGKFGSEAEPGLMGAEASTWFDRVEADIANIREALECLIAQGRIEASLELAGALAWFWSAPNYLAEGRAWYDRLLALASDEVDARVRAKALMFAGDLAHWHNENEPAAHLIEQALALARETGDTEKIAATLRGLASIAIDRMSYREAESLLAEAHDVAQHVDDPWNVAAIANLLGLALRLQGRYDEAERWHEAALRGWQESGSVDYLPVALHGLATARAGMGQVQLAWESVAAALALLDDREPTNESLTIMTEIAQLATRSDHLVTAIHLFATCARLRKELAVPVRPPELQRIDAGIARLRRKAGEAKFAQEWARGQALSHGETMTIARNMAESPGFDAALSTREREVLLLLVEGASDPDIADRLFISRRTASKHVAAIIEKLGATNRTAAVTTAHRRGLV